MTYSKSNWAIIPSNIIYIQRSPVAVKSH